MKLSKREALISIQFFGKQKLSEATKKGEKRMKIWDGSIEEWESKHPTQSLSHRCARKSRKEETDERSYEEVISINRIIALS